MNGWASLSRQATALCLVVAAGLVVMLMAINHQIRGLEKQVALLEQQIAADRQEARVLQAEFNFLTEPDRLRQVSMELLGLAPVTPGQVKTFATFDGFHTDEDPLARFLRQDTGYHPVSEAGR